LQRNKLKLGNIWQVWHKSWNFYP